MSVTEEERIKLCNRIGPNCTLMAAALARLYLASPSPNVKMNEDPILRSFPSLSDREWTYTHTQGFVVLLSDHEEDALVIRMYDFKKLQRRFEYEIYMDMEFKMLDPQFYAFEMETCMAGLSFSVKSDAILFNQKVCALRPSHKDSVQTLLRKMRSSTLAKDEFMMHRDPLTTSPSLAAKANQPSPGYVNCTPEQIKMLKEYQDARKKYEADVARYKAEQDALKKYQEEKRKYEEKYRSFLKGSEWGSEASTNSEASSLSSISLKY